MDSNQSFETIVKMLNDIKYDVGALFQAQQISNYLAMSTNMLIPEDLRKSALNKAMNMMGLSIDQTAEEQLDVSKTL